VDGGGDWRARALSRDGEAVGDSIVWKFWLCWALISLPAIPIAYAWRRLATGARATPIADTLPLSIVTLSVIWLDAAVANWWFIGPLYSRLHYAIIGGNLIADVVCLLVAVLFSFSPAARPRRLATALAGLMLALEWARMGIINR
jgi:hypothetical protein